MYDAIQFYWEHGTNIFVILEAQEEIAMEPSWYKKFAPATENFSAPSWALLGGQLTIRAQKTTQA